ncbi:carboxypeptidase regulatory-like domain-containing protein [Paucibacter sp. APW11]|uniref:Carboxypeptidase regulatory-like domain-containing protein n=1 Tax=Roseateles aquae TaxID=3077235 RepID=A0ABU3PJK5_9BURK|nr:carboxypeptidase regulatory-like domain-containing protein [Paucibacter sp. APW11]MDT9002221.1 carboxypeptidase regulatory-like domain-containing protein [Paucibacter sp. APW11]
MSNDSWSRFSRTALSAAVAIVAAAPALAQNTTAAVGGRVVSPDGKPVAGAQVVIRHVESGSSNTLTSDAEGRFSIRGLRVGGPYTVTVAKGGDREVRDDIYLQLAETLNLDLRLGAAANVLEKVVTTGSANVATFSSSNMGAGTSLSRKDLDAYASVSRSLADYARNDPRLAQTDKSRGEISALGQNSRFNSVTIDGVRTNDTFGLEGNGLPTLKQPISIDAIQAVQVNLSNFDVTQQGYTGANINAVTKSGTNELKGSVYAVYRDDQFSGKRFDNKTGVFSEAPSFREYTKGFTLGGPIIKDKLFFFGTYEEMSSSRSSPAFGPKGSSLVNVDITPEQLAAVQQVAKSKYGIDIGGPIASDSQKLTVKDSLLKLDWNVSEDHRVNVRFARTEQADPNFRGFGSNALSLSSYWDREIKKLDTTVAQWFADWTPDFSTELKVSNRKYDKYFDTNSNLPSVQLIYPAGFPDSSSKTERTLSFGTEASRHNNVLRTTTQDAYLAGNLVKDDHELKFGADYSSNEVYNAFLQNTKGVYTFKGTSAGVDPVTVFASGIPTTYTVQVPLAGKTLDDGIARWTLKNLGLFMQDTWTINSRLNITAGVRLDKASTNDTPALNQKALDKFGFNNTQTLDGKSLVQPRFGFNYKLDPKAEQKSQVRGGIGLFQGNAANVWLSNPYSNTGLATASFSCGTGTTPCPAGFTFNPNPDTQTALTGVPPAASVDFISPNLNQPSVWKFNLAYDTQLPWYGLTAGAEWLHTKNKQAIYYRHLNLGAVQATGPDGRELYYDAVAQDPTKCWKDGGTTLGCTGQAKAGRDKTFGNVLLADATGKGGGDTITLSLSRPARDGFGWQVAYSRMSAKEVSNLSSSTSNSGFNNRAAFNPNEEVLANSAYLVRDRINGAVNWSKAFVGSYKTTVGLFYEGRKGRPYSWTFRNDMNGDGVAGNDLMYIPTAPGSGEVIFRSPTSDKLSAADAEAKFWSIVNANPELAAAKGRTVSRNGSFAPFVNSFDLRLSQEVPGLRPKHKGVFTFDILNVGNLLNKNWGHIDEAPFGGVNSTNTGGNYRSFVNYAGMQNGKYIYSVTDADLLTTAQTANQSQWAIQATLRYEF